MGVGCVCDVLSDVCITQWGSTVMAMARLECKRALGQIVHVLHRPQVCDMQMLVTLVAHMMTATKQ